jgi:hypothetical protein
VPLALALAAAGCWLPRLLLLAAGCRGCRCSRALLLLLLLLAALPAAHNA